MKNKAITATTTIHQGKSLSSSSSPPPSSPSLGSSGGGGGAFTTTVCAELCELDVESSGAVDVLLDGLLFVVLVLPLPVDAGLTPDGSKFRRGSIVGAGVSCGIVIGEVGIDGGGKENVGGKVGIVGDGVYGRTRNWAIAP